MRTWHRSHHQDSRGFWVILCPDGLKLIQVVRAQDGPVPCEVVKVVHDDSYEEVNDLQEKRQRPHMNRWTGDAAEGL